MKIFLYEPKSKIGWVHGLISCLGAILLSFLTMMLLAKYIQNDYAIRIIPAMILTPILMSIYGLFILFSRSIIKSINKVLILTIFLILFLKVF